MSRVVVFEDEKYRKELEEAKEQARDKAGEELVSSIGLDPMNSKEDFETCMNMISGLLHRAVDIALAAGCGWKIEEMTRHFLAAWLQEKAHLVSQGVPSRALKATQSNYPPPPHSPEEVVEHGWPPVESDKDWAGTSAPPPETTVEEAMEEVLKDVIRPQKETLDLLGIQSEFERQQREREAFSRIYRDTEAPLVPGDKAGWLERAARMIGKTTNGEE
jgi:hypothetical protein